MKRFIIAAVLAAVSVPMIGNIRHAMLRAHQQETMSRIYRFGRALESYADRHGTYPRPDYVGPVSAVAPLLHETIETDDGWGRPILYHGARKMYALRSTARDGINDHQTAPANTHDLDADVVFANGIFMRVPFDICGGYGQKDDWDVKKYGECAECHPSRVRHLVTK